MPDEKLCELKEALADLISVSIFEQLFDSHVYQMIVDETIRYASTQKNKHDFSITADEIKMFFGFLIFTGYQTLPSERDY